MVATFNGWEDMPEQEREALAKWEEMLRSSQFTTESLRGAQPRSNPPGGGGIATLRSAQGRL